MGPTLPSIRAGLYIVATPIGTASDLSMRAIDLLSFGNVLVAEDKRVLLKLMKIHGIKLERRPLMSYNEHTGQEKRIKILQILKDKNSVVFVSDAGTPLVADPGYRLVSEVLAEGVYVTAIPGPSAVLTALTISGLPTDKFLFGGFIPTRAEAKRVFLAKYLNLSVTLVLYESAVRLIKTLNELLSFCDKNRKIAVCRELTKKFEDVQRGTLKDVVAYFSTQAKVKGEIVIVISPCEPRTFNNDQINDFLIDAMDYMSLKDAVSFVSKRLNISKKIIYKEGLRIQKDLQR